MDLGRSAVSAREVVPTTDTPTAWAIWRANTDTPPRPWTRTVCPARTGTGPVRADHAVSPAHGRVQAPSNDRGAGAGISPGTDLRGYAPQTIAMSRLFRATARTRTRTSPR